MSEIIFCSFENEFLPVKKTDGAVCRDLKITKDIEIESGKVVVVGTGTKIAFPIGRHSKIYARSSLSGKFGLMLANNVAVMDSDYRGEYFLQLFNFSEKKVSLTKGTRVAQLEILPYFVGNGVFGSKDIPNIKKIVDENIYNDFENIYSTSRGTGKFGSTGF